MYYDKYNTGLSMTFYYWKCNFPMNLYVRLIFNWLVRHQLISWLVGWSVWHNILKVTLLMLLSEHLFACRYEYLVQYNQNLIPEQYQWKRPGTCLYQIFNLYRAVLVE